MVAGGGQLYIQVGVALLSLVATLQVLKVHRPRFDRISLSTVGGQFHSRLRNSPDVEEQCEEAQLGYAHAESRHSATKPLTGVQSSFPAQVGVALAAEDEELADFFTPVVTQVVACAPSTLRDSPACI